MRLAENHIDIAHFGRYRLKLQQKRLVSMAKA